MPTLFTVNEDRTQEEVPTQLPTMSDTTGNSPMTPYQLSVPGTQDSTGTNDDLETPLAALDRHQNFTPTGGPSPLSNSGTAPRNARNQLRVSTFGYCVDLRAMRANGERPAAVQEGPENGLCVSRFDGVVSRGG